MLLITILKVRMQEMFLLKNRIIGNYSLFRKNKFIFVVSVLIFLYPLFGVSIKHWFSGFASLIIILGIIYSVNTLISSTKKIKLERGEIYLCVAIAMLFISYMLSGFVNGWNENQLEFFGGEFNFLLFIPLYIILRDVKHSAELLIKGTVLSGILMSPFFVHEFIIFNNDRLVGSYGHLFIGPIAVLISFTGISSYKYFSSNLVWKLLIIISVIFSFIATAYSKSGTAYVMVVVLTFITPFVILKGIIKKIVFMFIIYICILLSYFISPHIQSGADKVIDSVTLYLSVDKKDKLKLDLGTAGIRIELWIAAANIFNDNLLFGVGRNNFKSHAKTLKENGEISQTALNYSAHPHNIYAETLVSKGLFGFIILVVVFYLLFVNYIKAKNNNIRFSDVALIHLFFILIVGIGTEAPLIKNNFVSIFLLYSAVFYSHNAREISSN